VFTLAAFQQYFLYYRGLGFSLDISRMKFPDDFSILLARRAN
jgi:hypothetical protein